MTDLSPDNPLLFFGCGNMGRAMLDGWLRSGINPAAFIIVDPASAEYPTGAQHFTDAALYAGQVSTAVIAVKPQMFPQLAPRLSALLHPDARAISVMAGVRLDQLADALPGRQIIRLMPNLAAALGKSPLGLCAAQQAAASRLAIEELVSPLGTPVWIEDEALMDAVTALAGSGPAFVYRFIEALSRAGEALGLDPDIASKLAMAMVDGAVDLAANSDLSPQELATRVTSPGGTTAAGLAVLDADEALAVLVGDTLRAARDRGVELAKS
ncbi:ProC Pyrroline-5-carboxylate reductase [Sphingomonadaceae bacterium]